MYPAQNSGSSSQLPANTERTQQVIAPLSRLSFLKRAGLFGAAVFPGVSLISKSLRAEDGRSSEKITRGDAAILRFLAAAEILETDLWQQYTEIALGNPSFQAAISVLDGDMVTYINQNTRDEFSHQNFLNAYLESKGASGVNLEPFRKLSSSHATGSNKTAKRLTNLMNLTVDTSWYTRYRSSKNPDLGAQFDQIVNLKDVPGIPASDLPPPDDPTNGYKIQFIANVAGFHFATVEQGGSSLYTSFLTKVTNLEVLNIVGSIGGTEIMHFQTWQDKAGNAPMLMDNMGHTIFPDLPHGPAPVPDGVDHAAANDTNQIMPFPCDFVSTGLPRCSIIRPSSGKNAGARAAVSALTSMGLFLGQSDAFLGFLLELAEEADEARRQT